MFTQFTKNHRTTAAYQSHVSMPVNEKGADAIVVCPLLSGVFVVLTVIQPTFAADQPL